MSIASAFGSETRRRFGDASMCGGDRPPQTPAEAGREDAEARRVAGCHVEWPDLADLGDGVVEPAAKPPAPPSAAENPFNLPPGFQGSFSPTE